MDACGWLSGVVDDYWHNFEYSKGIKLFISINLSHFHNSIMVKNKKVKVVNEDITLLYHKITKI